MVDFREKFLKLFGYSVIVAALGVVAWAVLTLARSMIFGPQKQLRCQSNLKNLIEATTLYQSHYRGQRPPTLAALLPILEHRRDKFICPSDPDRGHEGSRPLWLRKDDGEIFKYVDLDGPMLDPGQDKDWLPCSYLYVANLYPCGLPAVDFERTWRAEFNRLVDKYGRGVPMVRCYYHLPEKYVEIPADDPAGKRTVRIPDPENRPTFNITADLDLREYRAYWQGEPEFKGAR
jgi:hypothetical protein